MPVDQSRIPSLSDLHQMFDKPDDFEVAAQELEAACNGGDCHDATAHMLRTDYDKLPPSPPTDVEPGWLNDLLYVIWAHRQHKGV